MSKLKPVSRDYLIKRLREFGFSGPYSGGKHSFMMKGKLGLILPNPHRSEISIDLLKRLLKQAEISREEWLSKEDD